MFEDARKVFAVFENGFKEKKGATNWWAGSEHIIENTGLPWPSIEPALAILERKGLLEHVCEDGWSLTDYGAEACEYPGLLDDVLPVAQ